MDIPDALINIAIGIIGGGVGGVVAGVYTLKATDKAIREENDKEVRRDEKEVQNLLDALGVEIGALWSFHMRRVGLLVEGLADGTALEFYYPLTQDYFSIYNANAAMIGRVKDGALREAIVVCYNKCKKVVDGFKYNNELYKEYSEAALLEKSTANDALRATRYQKLVDYASLVKEDHFELKSYVERLLGLIGTSQG